MMTKVEQLSHAAEALDTDQLDGLIAYTEYLSSKSFYVSAPSDVLSSIDRGIADAEAGNVASGAHVFGRLKKKISTHGA